MNEAIDLIIHRRSVRSYEQEDIPDEVLNTILQAGCAAPFAGPEEPWRLLVIRRKETKERLTEARRRGGGPPSHIEWCMEAPVVIGVAFKPTSMGGHSDRTELAMGVSSAASAIQNMLLAAAALGYGGSWCGSFTGAKAELEKALGIEAPWEFLAFIPIGKPSEPARHKDPKPLEKMVKYVDAEPAGAGNA